MLAKNTTTWGVVLGLLLAARVHAQPAPDSETKPPDAAAGADGTTDALTLQKGRAVLDAFLEISLSDGAAFKPVSLSPDIWYGVTDEITAGLVHSSVGTTGFIGGTGQSLCLTGSSGLCNDFYNNVGFDGRYKLKTGDISIAADGGLFIEQIKSPILLDLKLGAVGRWHQGKIAVEAAPALFLGLTNRSQTIMVGGVTTDVTTNADVISLPGTVLYTLNPEITLAGQTGLILPLENAGDAYAVPLSVGAFYHVNDQLNVTAAFSLPRLIAGSGGGIDARSLTLGGSYAF
jgi:hypothetical protein